MIGTRKMLILMQVGAWTEKRIDAIWTNILTNHLWRRMLKYTLATTITVILALIPAVVDIFGKAAYLGPFTTAFGHPGRRFGNMAEALVLMVGGTLLGVGWSSFGLYLSSLVYHQNMPAAYTIRGLFLTVALLLHGFLRSHTPRLFNFVLMLIVVSVVTLTSTATAVSMTTVTICLYPILTAAGVSLVVNVVIFPEFSSSSLGITTIETLGETVGTLRHAGKYFVSIAGDGEEKYEEAEDESSGPAIYRTMTYAEKPPEKTGKDAATTRLRKLFQKFKLGKKNKTISDKNTEGTKPSKSRLPMAVKLKSLTDSKAKLRAKLASCKAAQTECNFEVTWAVLPPRDMKPISSTHMKKLVANTIALVGACESKYALMGDADDKKEEDSKNEHQLKDVIDAANLGNSDNSSRPGTGADSSSDDSSDEKEDRKKKQKEQKEQIKSKMRLERELKDLEMIKPKKEIESGDIELLRFLVRRITKPLINLQAKIDRSVDVVTLCLAYCYDVPTLPCGAPAPKGVRLEEIDIRVDILAEAVADFDKDSALALETAAAMNDLDHPQIDVMPRMETFLISSFLLNLRQAALHTLELLKHSRVIVEKRQARHGRPRLYAPRINWRKWLISGGEREPFALPEIGKQDARRGQIESQDDDDSIISEETLVSRKKDEESGQNQSCPMQPAIKANQAVAAKHNARNPKKGTAMIRFRNNLVDIIEYLVGNEDVVYAIKLTVAILMVTWPAFLYQWNEWYSLNRGLWAALQLVFVIEVSIGTSVMTFILRALGTSIGCTWGHAAYEARNGNRFVCLAMLVIGIIPATYIHLGSRYVKVGLVSIISMCVVALATEDHIVPGSESDNYIKRLISFLVGGVVALIVELFLFPVKARDRLVESLAGSIRQISELEACLAYGIETEVNVDVHSAEVSARFERAKGKAQGALTAAEMFLPFCANEPRLKGSFKGLFLVYAEILYVLHAVVDRMDNMLHLRHEYGSGVLEELNEKVYPYRRNVAGAITLVLFACHEALTTKLPLPQFLPSARLAHLRMVNRVREVVLAGDVHKKQTNERSDIEVSMVKRVVRHKFLSWNAASAGQIEVIEYLEELVDLMKLLVGANEFRTGLLTRSKYRDDCIDRSATKERQGQKQGRSRSEGTVRQKDGQEEEHRDIVPAANAIKRPPLVRRRTTYTRDQDGMEKLKKIPTETQRFEKQIGSNEEELPRSLQRVRTRRIEEMSLQKSRTPDDSVRGKGEKKW